MFGGSGMQGFSPHKRGRVEYVFCGVLDGIETFFGEWRKIAMLKRKLVKEFLASAGLACCLLGVSLTGEARAATAYTDVQTSDWYYQAVTELSAEHILLGATGNTFSPGKAVSREDFATALWMLVTGGDTVVPEAVSDWVVQTGLFAVDTDLSVGLTRQEAAQCLSALIRNTGMTIRLR